VKKEKTWPISFRCPDATAAALDDLAHASGRTRTQMLIHLIDRASAITSGVFAYPDIMSMTWTECDAWEQHADQLEAAFRQLLTGFARPEPLPSRPVKRHPLHGKHALNEIYRLHQD
jgi:hypothetical protein